MTENQKEFFKKLAMLCDDYETWFIGEFELSFEKEADNDHYKICRFSKTNGKGLINILQKDEWVNYARINTRTG